MRLRVLLVVIGVSVAFLVAADTSASTLRGPLVTVVQTDGHLGEEMVTLTPLALRSETGAGIETGRGRGRGHGHGGAGTIRVNLGEAGGTLWGVGAAVTDSSAYLIHELPGPERTRLLTRLYGRAGLGLSFGAIPIGASDYSASGHPYTYDDLPVGQVDPTLAHFSIRHDDSWDLPVLEQIAQIQPEIRFFAATWTAPPWMKANDRFNDLKFGGSLLPRYYGAFARYLVDWLRAYATRGLRIAALAPENEPNSPSSVPAMYLPLEAQETFIAGYLAPALGASHLSTHIFGGDVGMPRGEEQEALVESSAGRDLGGLAWHCYSAPPTRLAVLARLAPGLGQIISECAEKLSRVPLAVDVLGALSNGASAFSAWNLALTPAGGPVQDPNRGCAGCRGLVAIDPRTHRYSLSQEAYVLGQVGHFVSPGAVRLATSDEPTWYSKGSVFGLEPNSGILNVAYRNPGGQLALITYNPSPQAKTVHISDGSEHFTATLPPGATTTFSWAPPRGGS
jgi:glucosylceramidase